MAHTRASARGCTRPRPRPRVHGSPVCRERDWRTNAAVYVYQRGNERNSGGGERRMERKKKKGVSAKCARLDEARRIALRHCVFPSCGLPLSLPSVFLSFPAFSYFLAAVLKADVSFRNLARDRFISRFSSCTLIVLYFEDVS